MIENNELKSVRLQQTISVKDLIAVDLPGTKNSLSLANKYSKCNKEVYRLNAFISIAVLSSQQMTIGKIYCAKLIYENYKHMKKKRLEKKKKVN